ncbi:MAG: type II CRISPR-associated endonuclease Cas1, partial [Flavobacteriaceae bacterium]|nr:type II CRISPR-associated endonuclease Cas1 [Flavobacteriaceae bacterium]
MLKRTLFFGSKCRLTTKYRQLVVHSEQRKTEIPIEDIGYVVLEHPELYISLPALQVLNEHQVAVIFCDAKHMPSAMLLNLDSHHLQHELFKEQINASEPLKKQLWQQTVKQKIKQQARHLALLNKDARVLDFFASKVLSGDTDNREGAAAAYYWKNLFEFEFKRERFGTYPNDLLNYGYILLRAATARALAG